MLLVGVPLCDLALSMSGDPLWKARALRLAEGGLACAVIAAGFGLRTFLEDAGFRRSAAGVLHAVAAATTLIAALWSLLLRLDEIGPGAEILSVATAIAALLAAGFARKARRQRHPIRP